MPDVVTIPFTTTNSHADLLLASFAATVERSKITVRVSETQDAVVRITPPAGSLDRLIAASTVVGGMTTATTAWTTLVDGSVESPPLDKPVDLELQLALITKNGEETARATPIVTIKKGGKPDPKKRALLIGTDLSDLVDAEVRLVGIANDLARVKSALERHDFHCHTLTGSAATRDGILAAIRQFTAVTAPSDVVLVYYTGHGGLAANPDHGAVDPPEPRYFQYIVPADHSPQRFRGIFSAELTALVAGLTAATPNVTVVLDCCHATGVVMGGRRRYRARAVPRPWAGDVTHFVAWLRSEGHDLSLAARHVEGNPHAVRLVACSPEETASEYEDANGDSGGLLTSAFVTQLNAAVDADPPPTWDAIGKAIHAAVTAEISSQNPDVLGPTSRRLFTVEETETRDTFATAVDSGYTFLRGGSIHGIRPGDRFLVLPHNVAVPDRELALAELEADVVTPHVTRVKRTDFSDRRPAPAGARAIRTTQTLRRHLVALKGAAATRTLAAAIAEAPRLALADPRLLAPEPPPVVLDAADIDILPGGVPPDAELLSDDPAAVQPIPAVLDLDADIEDISVDATIETPPIVLDPDAVELVPDAPAVAAIPLLAIVTGDEHTTTILDAEDTPVRVLPADESPERTRAIVGVLEQLARVQELLDLRSDGDGLALTPPKVEWSQVAGPALPATGARLKAGDRFSVIVTQLGARAIYVSILGVMPDRSIVLLSAPTPQGAYLAQDEKLVLGQDQAGQVVGIPIPWPDVVPAAAQPLEVVVVATDVAVDLRPLASDLHDVNELIARVGKRVVFLGDEPPAPRECRLAVVRLSARVVP